MTWRALRPKAAGEGGFTLVELLAAMFVLGILFAGFATVFTTVIKSSTQVQEESLLQTEVRAGVDRLAGELRQAYYGSGTSVIVSLSPTALTFYSPDRGTPTFHLREIAYQIAGGQLQRATAVSTNTSSTGPPWTLPALGGWVTVVGSIVNSVSSTSCGTSPSSGFTYLDSSGATTNTPASVATVGITLTAATSASAARQFTYCTTATLRATP